MTNAMWIGILRHVLTAVGGSLVAKGTIDASSLEMVVGAVTTLVGVAWSIGNKRNALTGPGSMNGRNTVG